MLQAFASFKNGKKQEAITPLMGNRFLTFNSMIRVNQIGVSRDVNKGYDEWNVHTPLKLIEFRNAIEQGFP